MNNRRDIFPWPFATNVYIGGPSTRPWSSIWIERVIRFLVASKVKARNYYHNGESSRVHSVVVRPKYRLRGLSLAYGSLRPPRSHRSMIAAHVREGTFKALQLRLHVHRLLGTEAESTSWFLRGVHRWTAVKCLLNALNRVFLFLRVFFELYAVRKSPSKISSFWKGEIWNFGYQWLI